MDRSQVNPTEGFVRFPRHPRTGTVVSVRLDAPHALALHRAAHERKTTISDIARDALNAYLDQRPAANPALARGTMTAGFSDGVEAHWTQRMLGSVTTRGTKPNLIPAEG